MSASGQVWTGSVKPAVLGRSMHSNFCWLLAGNAVYSFCQWMTLVALAKLGTPLMLGQFSLGLAIASPVLTFANLNLRAVQATDAKEQYWFSEYLGLRTVSTAAGCVVIAAIALLGNFHARTAVIVLAVGLAKAMESLSDLFYGLFQRCEELKRTAISMILRGTLAVLVLALVLFLTRDILWAALTMALTWGLVWALHDVKWGRWILERHWGRGAGAEAHRLRPVYDLARQISLVRLAFPLGVVMMFVALNANIPRYFVQYRMGEENLGMFSAMAYAMVAVTGVAESLGQSATPKLARYYASGQLSRFRELLLWLIVCGTVLGLAAVATARLGGPTLLTLLYRPQYAEYAGVFVWLTVAAGLTCVGWMLNYGVTAARYFKIQVPMFAAISLSIATGCYFLVPRMGMRGAAIALVLGALVHVSLAGGALVWVLGRHETQHQEELGPLQPEASPASEA